MSKGLDVHAREGDADSEDDPAVGAATAASIAAYIAEMSAELATMAERAELPMLCYFLRLARVEAETKARDLARPAPTVDGSGRA